MKRHWFWVVGMVAAVSSADAAELLVNGDFEDGDIGQITAGIPGWSSWGDAGWHHSDPGETLDAKALMFWWDTAGLWQDVTITGGATLTYGVQVLNDSDDLCSWNLLVRLEFYNSGIGTAPGDILGTESQKFFSASEPVDQWVTMSQTIVAPANADIARIVLNLTDWFAGVGGTLNMDNASIVAVPEPAALTGLTLAGWVLLGRCRKTDKYCRKQA